MSLRFLILVAAIFPTIVCADTLVAARTIRAQTVLAAADVVVLRNDSSGLPAKIKDVIGLETRVTLYEGRPINNGDLGPATIIERNQTVTLMYNSGGLSISAEARSLGRGGIGETVRVLNLASRNIIAGIVSSNGTILVGNNQQN